MLTKKETDFVQYWELNGKRKKQLYRQLSVGLPLGVGIVLAILVNFFAGWYKRADMEIRTTVTPSLIIVILVAGLGIVVFITIFSARHRWDVNEQYYKELIARRDLP